MVVGAWLLAGCRTNNANQEQFGASGGGTPRLASVAPGKAMSSAADPAPQPETIDTLHVGDGLTIEFSDMAIPVPPREERIKEDGTITLLEGKTFVANGKTRGQLEKEIHDWYVPRFYLKMTVSVGRQKDTQFYYVRGEVKAPTRQIYISRLRLLQAIASAGDFTDFAKKRKVLLTRADGTKTVINCIKARTDPKLNVEILPGDIIDVPRRTPWSW
jgi:protein involved in polysaccharide export with SLBB domain